MSQTDAQMLRAIAAGERLEDAHATRSVLERIASQLESDAKRFEESKQLQDIGRSCFENIADMVASLECDYDRLAELREEKQRLIDAEEGDLPDDNAEELAELEAAAGDCESREDAEQRITEDPLSIELAGTWSSGETPTADRAIILLGTGGPATRIVCELDGNQEPHRAWIESQDWFKPWTQYIGGDQETLLTYCRCLYFGEG